MKNVFTLLLVIFGLTLSSCQESEAPLEAGETVALSRISENSAFTSLHRDL